MKGIVAVRCSLPAATRTNRLGVVDAIRDAVKRVRELHPHLKRVPLLDVSLLRVGAERRLILYFGDSTRG